MTPVTHGSDTRVRLAVVGGGGMSKAHIRALSQHADRAQVVAICDPYDAALAAVQPDVPDAKPFSSIEEMLASISFDAAIIATPHHLHASQAAQLASAGIHCLVEKPVTCTTAQLRELAEVAERNGTIVMPGQTRRFLPEVQWLKAQMAADPRLIGNVTNVALQSLQDVRAYTRGRQHWILDGDLAGGGVTISLAVHQLDLIRYLTGHDYQTVSALASYQPPFFNGAESDLNATFRLTNGAIGSLQASYDAPKIPFGESLLIIGEHGSISQHSTAPGQYTGPLMIASSAGNPPSSWSDQMAGWSSIPPVPGLELSNDPIRNEQDHFFDVITGQAQPFITLRNNFNTIACINALTVSAKTGEPVTVDQW